MSYQIVITTEAYSDADEIIDWINQYAPDKSMFCFFDFLDAAGSLQNFPNRCSLARESTDEKELRQLLFGKYRLVFSVEANSVFVLHVKHQKQRQLKPDEL